MARPCRTEVSRPATMLVGGYRALRQTDIKLILAYGTVSQLGFITMVVGLGKPDAALAAAHRRRRASRRNTA